MHITLADKRATVGLTTLTLVGLLGFGLTASAQTYNNHDNDGSGSIYEADLSGSKEVPSVSSGVTGYAGVWIGDNDGEGTNYWLDVFDGEEVTAAHLHCAPSGKNGPVVVGLFEDEDGVDVDGRLAESSIDDGDIESSGEDCDDTIGYEINNLNDLINAIEDGDIYVNVHTEEYPNGAARGQLEFSERSDDKDNSHDKDDKGDRKNEHKDDRMNKDNRDHDKDRSHDDKNKNDRKNDRHDDRGDDKSYDHEKDRKDRDSYDNDKGDHRSSDGKNGRDGKDGNDGRNGKDSHDGKDRNSGDNDSRKDNKSDDKSDNNKRSNSVDVRGVLNDLKSMVFGQ